MALCIHSLKSHCVDDRLLGVEDGGFAEPFPVIAGFVGIAPIGQLYLCRARCALGGREHSGVGHAPIAVDLFLNQVAQPAPIDCEIASLVCRIPLRYGAQCLTESKSQFRRLQRFKGVRPTRNTHRRCARIHGQRSAIKGVRGLCSGQAGIEAYLGGIGTISKRLLGQNREFAAGKQRNEFSRAL